jgi:SAM-dependent methyltransferase
VAGNLIVQQHSLRTVMDDEYSAVAELYDHVVPYATRGDVEFFVDEARRAGGAVLEVGCGTGRVLIPTARAGVAIEGIDASEAMLDVLRGKLAREDAAVRSRVHLHQADMRGFNLGRTFALATLPFRPFQHLLTVDDQVSCLTSIHHHLDPGGRVILDLFNPSLEFLVNRPIGELLPEGPAATLADGRRLERHFRIAAQDLFTQVNDIELVYDVTESDGRKRRAVHAFRMRYLFRYEAEHLLSRCGFVVEELYSGYDRSPYGSVYPGELIFVARKA